MARYSRLFVALFILAAATLLYARQDRSEPPAKTPPSWHDDASQRHQDPKALEILMAGASALRPSPARITPRAIETKT